MTTTYIRLHGRDLIEISDGERNITFRRKADDPRYWTLEQECGISRGESKKHCAHTFKPDREYPNPIGLRKRNGWSILEAEIKEDHFKWVDKVKAQKGRNTVSVYLQDGLEGPRSALLDFLQSYRASIEFWDINDI